MSFKDTNPRTKDQVGSRNSSKGAESFVSVEDKNVYDEIVRKAVRYRSHMNGAIKEYSGISCDLASLDAKGCKRRRVGQEDESGDTDLERLWRRNADNARSSRGRASGQASTLGVSGAAGQCGDGNDEEDGDEDSTNEFGGDAMERIMADEETRRLSLAHSTSNNNVLPGSENDADSVSADVQLLFTSGRRPESTGHDLSKASKTGKGRQRARRSRVQVADKEKVYFGKGFFPC